MADPKNPWLFGEPQPQPGPPVVPAPVARRSLWLRDRTGDLPVTDADRELAELVAAEKARQEAMKSAPRVEAWRSQSDQNRAVSDDDGEHLGWLENTLSVADKIVGALNPTHNLTKGISDAVTNPGAALKTTGEAFSELPHMGRYLAQGGDDVERLELRYKREYGGGLNPDEASRLSMLEEKNRLGAFIGDQPKTIVGQAVRSLPNTGAVMVKALPVGLYGAVGGGLLGAGGGSAIAPGPGTAVGARVGAQTGFEAGMLAGSIGPSFQLNVASVDEELASLIGEDGTMLTPGERKTTAIGAGVIITALDSFGLSRIVKASGLGPGDVSRPGLMLLLRKKEVRAAIKDVVGRYGEAAIAEGSTEALQELFQVVFVERGRGAAERRSGDTFKRPTMGENVERVTEAGTVGGLVGGAFTTPGVALDLTRMHQQEGQAKARAKLLEGLAGGPDSKLKTELPEKYREVVNAITKDGPVENVYVTAEPLLELFQSQGVDPAEALKALGLPDDALEIAQREGGEVKIPMATYLSQIVNTELDAGIQKHVKFRPGDQEMTLAEAEDFRANYPEVVKALEEEAAGAVSMTEERRAERKVLRDTVTAELSKDTGFTPEQIAGQVDARVEFYESVMRSQGLTLDEARAMWPLETVRSHYERPAGRTPAAPVDMTDYEAVTRHRESRGKLTAKATTSSALGPHQFIDGTWAAIVKRHGLPGVENAKAVAASIRFRNGRAIIETEEQRKLMALRTNDAASTAAFHALTQENQAALRKALGREPTAAELYIAHFAGSGGAKRLLTADPAASAAEVLPASARANPTIFYTGKGEARRSRTVAEVVAELSKDHGGATYSPGAAAPVETAADTTIPDMPEKGALVLDQFAGRSAATADFGKLRTAQLMELRDSYPTDIWEATGWMKGVDGRWRFEIDDSEARLKPGLVEKLQGMADRDAVALLAEPLAKLNDPETNAWAERSRQLPDLLLSDIIEHDKLFAAYPGLATVKVGQINQLGIRGAIDLEAGELLLGKGVAATPEQALSTILHEVQHLIQVMEGFAVGATADRAMLHRMGYGAALQRVTDEMVAEYPPGNRAAARERIEQMAHAVRETYRRSEGEVEARNVQARQFMTEDERRDVPPDFTRDVPREKAAVALVGDADGRALRARYLDTEASKTFYQSDALYSALGRAIERSTTERASPDQWIATLKKTPGIKAEELQWSGVLDYLEGRKTTPAPGYERTTPVSRDELLTFVTANGVSVEVVELGAGPDQYEVDELADRLREVEIEGHLHDGLSQEEAEAQADAWDFSTAAYERLTTNATQFESHKLPGADDTYRELLFQLPNIKGPSTHWDQENVVAHARTTIRQDAEGNRVLFVEEVQSDWHQKGRDRGYARKGTPEEIAAAEAAIGVSSAALRRARSAVIDAVQRELSSIDYTEAGKLEQRQAGAARVLMDPQHAENHFSFARDLASDAQSWASPEGYAAIGEALGIAYAEDLKNTEAVVALQQMQGHGIPDAPFRTGWPALVMKRLIRYAVDQGLGRIAWTTGDQIGPVVGANSPEQRAGLNAFYGRNLVNIVNDLTKKYGAKVGEITVQFGRNTGGVSGHAVGAALGIPESEISPWWVALEYSERERLIEEYRSRKLHGDQPGIIITPELAEAARGGFTLFQRQDGSQTETPEFRRWFGDSKVVDAEGRPLVVYHGTNQPVDAFDMARGGANTKALMAEGAAWFASDPAVSSLYAEAAGRTMIADEAAHDAETERLTAAIAAAERRRDWDEMEELTTQLEDHELGGIRSDEITGQQVLPVYLSVHNPAIITAVGGAAPLDFAEQVAAAKAAGHDGVIVRELSDPPGSPVADHFAVFEPAQIKSRFNSGAFDPSDPSILRQGENDTSRRPVRRGAITLPGNFGRGGQAIVDLFQGRDLSTFAHEVAGHYTLEQLRSIVRAGNPTPQTQAMVDALLAWFNVPTVEDIGVREHEMFAEAIEQYLYEGRAPSLRLRSTFATYRAWMVGIYGKTKGVRADVPDEVRAVFDRLLASQEELEAARQAQQLEPLFSDKDLVTLPPEVAAAYRQIAASARRDAEDDLDREMLAALVREQRAWYQAEKQRVRDDVEAEVVARPEWRAFEWLAHGKWLGDEPQPEWLGDPVKLSRPVLLAEYGEGILKSLKRGFGRVYAEDGAHPDMVAEMFEFDSGREMIDALTALGDRNRVINEETDRRMVETHGDPMVDGTAPDVAMAALHNVSQQRMIELELRQLQGRPAMRGLREAAEAQTLRRLVKDVEQADRHLASERKAANAAMRAFRKGDVTEAARQKFRQLVAFHSWSAARRAGKEIEKADRLFGRVVGGKLDNVAKARNMDLVMAARAILAAHGIGKVEGQTQAYIAAVAAYDPELFELIGPEIAAAIDGAKGDTRELTVEEMMALRSVVGSLYARARADKVIELDGRQVELETAASEIADQLFTQTPLSRADRTEGVTDGEKFLQGLAGIRGSLRRVESWMRRVDNGVGPLTRYLWRPISEGADAHRAYSARFRRAYANLLTAIAPSLTWGKIDARELRWTFANKAELLHAVLHTGNDSNKRKLLLGGQGGQPWAIEAEDGSLNTGSWDAFVSRMITEGVLTKADYDFAQGVWNLLEQTKPDAQRTHRRVFGRYFEEVTANAFSTPFGNYRGGYVPASVNTMLVPEGAIRAEAEKLEGGGSFMFPSPPRGFTKSRVETYAKPLALDLRLLSGHIDKVSMFIHLSMPVKNALRILKRGDVAEALLRFDPTAQTDMLLPWLERASRQIVSTPMAGRGGALVDAFARELRSRTGLNTMFANLTNALQQFTGFSLSLVAVKGKHMNRALVSYLKAPSVMAEAARQASPFMADRLDNQSMEASQDLADMLIRPTLYGKATSAVVRHGYFLQHAFQNVVDLTTWTAAHYQAQEAGADPREAVRQADAAVRQTQGSLNPEDISRFESGNTIQRLFTQFASYFNMQANLLVTEGGMAARSGRGLRLAWVILMGFTVPAILADAIKRGMTGGFDDDDDDGYLDVWFDWLFMSQVRGALAMVPVAGPWANTAMNMFNDKPYDDRLSLSPGVGSLDAAARTPVNIARLAGGEGDWSRTAKDTLTLLGLVTRLPLGALGRPVGYGLDVMEGDVEPTDPVDAVRGAVTGAPSPASRE